MKNPPEEEETAGSGEGLKFSPEDEQTAADIVIGFEYPEEAAVPSSEDILNN